MFFAAGIADSTLLAKIIKVGIKDIEVFRMVIKKTVPHAFLWRWNRMESIFKEYGGEVSGVRDNTSTLQWKRSSTIASGQLFLGGDSERGGITG